MTYYLQRNNIEELSYTVPKLPILTSSNKNEYPEWHNYFKKVYSQNVETDVDSIKCYCYFPKNFYLCISSI